MTLPVISGLLVVAWAVYAFNRPTQLRQLGDNAWADIDVQLKRRHDLIPNVVAVVQGHAGYERSTLEAVVAARGRAVQAAQAGPATRAREEDPLGNALQRVVAVAEAYPELKAAASFASLQATLTDVEDHLQNARRYYNAVVRDFNTAIAQFPSGIIAGMMRLAPREFFGLDDPAERAVPKVPVVLLLLGLSATSLAAQRSYTIERFDARIRVNADASIDVIESITAQFIGSYNGLYRTIPIKYRNAQGLNWTLGVSLQSARDDRGRDLRTETSRQGASIKYKVWIPGADNATKTLVLRYHATNGLRFFDEHDELDWNVTGAEWEGPIDVATAVITLRAGGPGRRGRAATWPQHKADRRAAPATLVDLAGRGYLRIEEQQNPKLFGLFGGGTTYILHRLKPADGLAGHERAIFDGIFSHGEHVPLDELKDEFYTQLGPIRDAIYNQLKASGFYQNRPDKVKQVWLGCGIGFAILIGVGGAFVAAAFLLTP